MGSIKELLFDIQEEWRHEWISINYPEAEEETLGKVRISGEILLG